MAQQGIWYNGFIAEPFFDGRFLAAAPCQEGTATFKKASLKWKR